MILGHSSQQFFAVEVALSQLRENVPMKKGGVVIIRSMSKRSYTVLSQVGGGY